MRSLVLSAAALIGLAGAVQSGPSLSMDDIARFEVLPGWRTASGNHMAALRVTLAPGWKTYWRAPGDAGIPPRFDWAGSSNIASVAFHWPTPDIFDQNGMRTLGYAHELVLPMEFAPREAGGAMSVRADIELGVCEDVCVPMTARISAELPPGGGRDRRISAAMDRRPLSEREGGVRDATCQVEPIRDGLRVTATIDMPRLGPEEMAVFELSDQTVWVAAAMTRRSGGKLTSVTEMVPSNNAPFYLDRSDVRITVFGAGQAVDIRGC